MKYTQTNTDEIQTWKIAYEETQRKLAQAERERDEAREKMASVLPEGVDCAEYIDALHGRLIKLAQAKRDRDEVVADLVRLRVAARAVIERWNSRGSLTEPMQNLERLLWEEGRQNDSK